MLSLWLTLVADAYPLICPVASSPHFKWYQIQPFEPGCWFSRTIGLSAAGIELDGVEAAQANRLNRAVTTTRLILINAAPSPPVPLAPYLKHDVEVAKLDTSVSDGGEPLVSEARCHHSHR